MATTTLSSPGRFTHGRSPHCVVMPMYVKWEGDSEEEATPDPQGEVDQAVDESAGYEPGAEPVEGHLDSEVDTAVEAPKSEPALEEVDIPVDTEPHGAGAPQRPREPW